MSEAAVFYEGKLPVWETTFLLTCNKQSIVCACTLRPESKLLMA